MVEQLHTSVAPWIKAMCVKELIFALISWPVLKMASLNKSNPGGSMWI